MMTRINRDFHGLTVLEASHELHQVISNIRRTLGSAHVFLIVGHGPIRDEVFEIYSAYGIDAHQDIGNAGVIVATVE